MKLRRWMGCWGCLLLLSACSSWLGGASKPVAASVTLPPAEPTAGSASEPSIDPSWWVLLADPELDRLQTQLAAGNVNVRLLAARVQQAQATLAMVQSGASPTVSVSTAVGRAQSAGGSAANAWNLTAPLSWEVDVWGRLQANTVAAQASLQASQEDLALARLSAQASLVQTYVTVRAAERQAQVLTQALVAYERALQLTQYRYEAGVVSAGDVAQARLQVNTTQAQLIESQANRLQGLNALAVLLGQEPGQLTLALTHALPTAPDLPEVVPASLLQRRPDVRAAQQRVRSAQASLGATQASFFPALTFNASAGYSSASLSSLFSASSLLWSLGPTMALNLFDGGLRKANEANAMAALDAAGLTYQQTVLQALQELQDNLMLAYQLQLQAQAQSKALVAAHDSLAITQAQYDAGMVSYLNVVNAQTAALGTERALLDTEAKRLLALTQLMKNLAGRW